MYILPIINELRLYFTETYSISRLFRDYDLTKQHKINCNTIDNSINNIVFAGKSHINNIVQFLKYIDIDYNYSNITKYKDLQEKKTVYCYYKRNFRRFWDS
tara:strand:+ start:3762 stop:4064 length:303 start_codon:yes stop_codon:yes gene_type:complete